MTAKVEFKSIGQSKQRLRRYYNECLSWYSYLKNLVETPADAALAAKMSSGHHHK